MSLQKSIIFEEARKLPPIERAELIEHLLESFSDKDQKEIDKRWAKEAQSRIEAYKTGQLEYMSIDHVFVEIEAELKKEGNGTGHKAPKKQCF